ncbi:MAG: SDR family oxidoreductase [Cyclobacteriaceae bacterium]|nr:SDR family oxidoreductase [Cyclobacteriaceae bacterium]
MSDTKNYLIIGGNSGIGLALANRLAERNNSVMIASRNAIATKGKSFNYNAMTDDLTLSDLPEQLHGLVYCPGTINLKPFHRLSDQDFIDDFQLNVMGAIRTIRSVLPILKNSQPSSILLFSTVAVQQGMAFHSSVAASKGAVEGLTRSLAAELAPRIRVNCIAPSLTNTPLASKLLSSEEKKKAADDRHPLKRTGAPEDLAALAAFLLSEEASWITGQVIAVDGGLSSIRA